jgi:hypothetical protein
VLNDTPAPGAYDSHLIPFGADIKQSMTLGGPYEFKYNDNPPPGLYEIDRARDMVSPTARSALIVTDVSPFRRPKDSNPDPGAYEG